MIDFISILREHIPRFKKVLELESKKGDDLKLLHEYYEVVASEVEQINVRALKDEFIDIRVLKLDVLKVDTHKRFDCIFTRNVLDKLSLSEINESFENQKKVLNPEGMIFHIFDLNKVDKNEVLTLLNCNYELVEEKTFANSFYILGKVIDSNQ